MADYEFKYRLENAPSPRDDGSGMVIHDVSAIARVIGSGDDFQVVPGRHKNIAIPASEVQAALAGPSIVNLYKQALARNLDTSPVPVVGWSAAQLEILMDNNDASAAAATAADAYIVSITPEPHYPVDFDF